ncbi:MAG: Phosphoribosylformylglycinamidine cyclo-ligase [Pseudomonadota bacterium]|jgi:phosphoribosylformylglycinamidine cyclo-ligase
MTTYREAGVDIEAADRFVARVAAMAESTRRPELLSGVGGLGARLRLPVERYRRPVLVTSTDGVGTKLLLAHAAGRLDVIGTDLVAMCVNDVVVSGAEPLAFLDYFACGRLDTEVAEGVLSGVVEGCRQAGCALAGGETAELPDQYSGGGFDLAGFAAGLVEEDRALDGRAIVPGDVVVGLASSGLHANGFSLVRDILLRHPAALAEAFEAADGSVVDHLLVPTRIYVRCILDLLERADVHGLVHVTGGGLPRALGRLLPRSLGVALEAHCWPRPRLFDALAEAGDVAFGEMSRTFNLGLGMCAVVPPSSVRSAVEVAAAHGIEAWPVGSVARASGASRVVVAP